jgi:hypothetical protein
MSATLSNLEYLKYIEPHLSLKILEFLLKQNSTEEIKSLYKKLSLQTKNFEKIQSEKYMTESELNELKTKSESEIKELEEKLKGFLNLSENCEKQKTHDLNFFSLGKKIIEQTSPIEILQYSTKLFDTRNFEKASIVLNSFSIFHDNNQKTKSKAIYALYLLYSIKVFMGENAQDIEEQFIRITKSIDKLKNIFDSSFKKADFDSVDKGQVDFKEVLLYRGYLLHWALFMIKYNSALFLDTLFDEKYFSLIESSFVYLLKYLIVFSVINGSRKYITKLKDTITKKRNFMDKHKDCFIFLLENILVNFNYKDAMKNLEDCKNLMKNDYFLYEYIEVFDKKLKEFILENYLILNKCVNIDDIKFLFNENEEETKKNLIDYIEYFYPNAKIKEDNKKISYEVDEDEINNYYKIKTEDLYSLTKNMVEFFKENKNN